MIKSLCLTFFLLFTNFIGAEPAPLHTFPFDHTTYSSNPFPSHPNSSSIPASSNPYALENLENKANFPTTDEHFLKDFMSMLTTLGLIIVFIFFVSWFLKKMLNSRLQQLNTTSEIKILERRALTPKSAIYLIEIKGKEMVIGESSNGLSLLADFKNVKPSLSFDTFLDANKEKEV